MGLVYQTSVIARIYCLPYCLSRYACTCVGYDEEPQILWINIVQFIIIEKNAHRRKRSQEQDLTHAAFILTNASFLMAFQDLRGTGIEYHGHEPRYTPYVGHKSWAKLCFRYW